MLSLTKGNMYENYDLCSLGIQTLQNITVHPSNDERKILHKLADPPASSFTVQDILQHIHEHGVPVVFGSAITLMPCYPTLTQNPSCHRKS